MAASPTAYLRSKMNSTQLSISCASNVSVVSRARAPNCLRAGKPSLNAEFFDKVHKTIASSNGKVTCGGRFTMMPVGTPRVYYKNRAEGSWQWVDVINALYRERIIFLGQFINEEYSNQILATMLYLDSIDDVNRLAIYLCSPGGELAPGLSIYDTMQSLRSRISTHNLCLAQNMMGFILAAGEKGHRTAMPLSRVRLGSPAGSAHGRADAVVQEATELVRVKDYLFNELAKITGNPVEKIHKDLKPVKYFSAQEAIEYGLIDRVVRSGSGRARAEGNSTKGLG